MLYGFKILLDGFKIVMLLCSFSLAEMYYEVIKNCDVKTYGLLMY